VELCWALAIMDEEAWLKLGTEWAKIVGLWLRNHQMQRCTCIVPLP
jgi:hypothetical protein